MFEHHICLSIILNCICTVILVCYAEYIVQIQTKSVTTRNMSIKL